MLLLGWNSCIQQKQQATQNVSFLYFCKHRRTLQLSQCDCLPFLIKTLNLITAKYQTTTKRVQLIHQKQAPVSSQLSATSFYYQSKQHVTMYMITIKTFPPPPPPKQGVVGQQKDSNTFFYIIYIYIYILSVNCDSPGSTTTHRKSYTQQH